MKESILPQSIRARLMLGAHGSKLLKWPYMRQTAVVEYAKIFHHHHRAFL
jgi:hypothetical protein